MTLFKKFSGFIPFPSSTHPYKDIMKTDNEELSPSPLSLEEQHLLEALIRAISSEDTKDFAVLWRWWTKQYINGRINSSMYREGLQALNSSANCLRLKLLGDTLSTVD